MANEFIARNGMISRGNVVVTGSLTTSDSLTTTGTITATTLVVQTITSSISSITGSTNFGSIADNTHTFTGSMSVSGSGTFTGALSGTSATFSGDLTIDTNTLYVDSTNNRVGIGTMPSYKLHIIESTTNGRAVQGVATATSGTNYGAVLVAEGIGATKNIGLYASAEGATTNVAAVFDNGNVGIGTSSPSAKLEVSTQDYLRVSRPTNDQYVNIYYAGIECSPTNHFYINAGTGYGTVFKTNGGTERMRITSGGDLYVGATSGARGSTATKGLIKMGTSQEYFELQANTTSTSTGLLFSDGSTGNYGLVQYDNSDNMLLYTAATERMRITSGGNVGIGTDSPDTLLQIRSTNSILRISNSTSGLSDADLDLDVTNTGLARIRQYGNYSMTFATNNTERMRITSAGYVGINSVSPISQLSVKGVGGATGVTLTLENGGGVVALNDPMGIIDFYSNDPSVLSNGVFGRISVNNEFNGAWNGTQSRVATYMSFSTSANATLSEKMRITSGGSVLFQKSAANNTDTGAGWFVNDYFCATNNSADSGDRVVLINRQNSDGTLIDFRQANVTEGSISVSGTTVSYTGGHLSRYSQTELNEKIEGLLKGTVMSNLDKMAVWINPETGEPYANEQLNCMKISDVEGDKNVAGVFVNWEYDSELLTNDMNIAMTGDMIIRIAQGLVVEKGDLLISAGDGTAKPQEDDIVRSKTIAKVTSNHITCVYGDGSYCVPCVLMAC